MVAKNCDIADPSDLTQVAEDCVREMAPVRGIIHAAMVLQVGSDHFLFGIGS